MGCISSLLVSRACVTCRSADSSCVKGSTFSSSGSSCTFLSSNYRGRKLKMFSSRCAGHDQTAKPRTVRTPAYPWPLSPDVGEVSTLSQSWHVSTSFVSPFHTAFLTQWCLVLPGCRSPRGYGRLQVQGQALAAQLSCLLGSSRAVR